MSDTSETVDQFWRSWSVVYYYF